MAIQDVKKLPQWAQDNFNLLTMRLREAKEEIAKLKENPPSNTIVGFENTEGMGMGKTHYLPNNSMITFKLPKGKMIVRIKDDVLDISAQILSISDFVVIPRSTNGLELKFIK